MIEGRFEDTSGRPTIEAKIILPRLGIKDNISLLGRDVLDRWRIIYDPRGTGLRAKPRSADITIDLAKSTEAQ